MKIFPNTYKTLFLLVATLSFFALTSAYFVEYNMHIAPCPLCLYQRIPYFLLLLLGSIGCALKTTNFSKYIAYFCGIIFLFGSLIALYHVAIEKDVIQEPTSCSISFSKKETIDSLRMAIQNNHVQCKDVKLRIAGFSMAEINTATSFIMFLYILLAARKIENQKIKMRESLEIMGINTKLDS